MKQTPADAEQEAYFRESPDAERRQLLDGILERRPLIERRADASRLHSAVHRAESQVRRGCGQNVRRAAMWRRIRRHPRRQGRGLPHTQPRCSRMPCHTSQAPPISNTAATRNKRIERTSMGADPMRLVGMTCWRPLGYNSARRPCLRRADSFTRRRCTRQVFDSRCQRIERTRPRRRHHNAHQNVGADRGESEVEERTAISLVGCQAACFVQRIRCKEQMKCRRRWPTDAQHRPTEQCVECLDPQRLLVRW
jgi:hypothetical protein